MNATWREAVGGQFGAALDMLERAMRACPETLWGDRARRPEFWYLVYHTLFFLDFYLAEIERDFAPPPPFTLGELDPAGVMPERVYTRDELLDYLGHGRERLRRRLASMTDAEAAAPCGFARKDFSTGELLLYNQRHVQHHAAQLYLILRQVTDSAPGWVGRGGVETR